MIYHIGLAGWQSHLFDHFHGIFMILHGNFIKMMTFCPKPYIYIRFRDVLKTIKSDQNHDFLHQTLFKQWFARRPENHENHDVCRKPYIYIRLRNIFMISVMSTFCRKPYIYCLLYTSDAADE